MIDTDCQRIIGRWRLPEGGTLQDRVERMIRPALLAGLFGASCTRYVTGLQYHLSGQTDTAELAALADITADDHVLDVCCFICGPALQLAETFGCRVTGIDLEPNCTAAANRLAELTGLARLATFRVADAGNLDFDNESFSVVWNQGSLEHYDVWLRGFDRVLMPGGRLAITFEIGNERPDTRDSRWRLEDVAEYVESLGYRVKQADDISQRDIELGWQVLQRKLSEHKQEYAWLLGVDWVDRAQGEFAGAIAEMQAGEWGNGRIIAIKSEHKD